MDTVPADKYFALFTKIANVEAYLKYAEFPSIEGVKERLNQTNTSENKGESA